MNMITYASPIALRPQRKYALGLYIQSMSYQNVKETGRGVLQVIAATPAAILPAVQHSRQHMEQTADGNVIHPHDMMSGSQHCDTAADHARTSWLINVGQKPVKLRHTADQSFAMLAGLTF